MKIIVGQIWQHKRKERSNMEVVEILKNLVAITYEKNMGFNRFEQLDWIKKDWLLEDWEIA